MDELRMVKIFKRSAAGDEEQLPSDLRPPRVLLRTCEYLFDDLIGNAPSLAKVHNFVWNRTRAIRRDFSIQQVSKPDDLRIAIECYERIARFHILSLHDLSQPIKPYPEYDYKQDREQLDKTLLSLMQYYDDSRDRIELPNEPEFRAYCIVFQIQDFTPDLEDRVQTWPIEVARDSRVQTALELYAAAGSITELKGPLKTSAIQQFNAQQDWQVFFNLVESARVSFLMGCVAEIFFNFVRHQTLDCIVRSAPKFRQTGRPNPNHFVEIETLRNLLAFDEEDEVIDFCARYGLQVTENGDELNLDIARLAGTSLPQAQTPAPPLRTLLVSNKRYGRSFPAVISGMTVGEAANADMLISGEDMDGYENGHENGQSLFIPENNSASDSDMDSPTGPSSGFMSKTKVDTSGFGQPSSKLSVAPPTGPSAKPSSAPLFKSPFDVNAPPALSQTGAFSPFAPRAQETTSKPAFDFLAAKSKNEDRKSTPSSLFAAPSDPSANGHSKSGFGATSNSSFSISPFSSPFTSAENDSSVGNTSAKQAPLFQWGAPSSAARSTGLLDAAEQPPHDSATVKATSAPALSLDTSSIFQAPAFLQPTPRTNATPSFLQPTSPPPTANVSSSNPFQVTPPTKAPATTINDSLFSSTAPPSAGLMSIPSVFTPSTQVQPATASNSAAQSDASSGTAQAQPISPSASSQQNGQTTAASLSVDEQKLRRSSTDTKPRKPSPLSHSFSAEDDNPGFKEKAVGALPDKPYPHMNITFGTHDNKMNSAATSPAVAAPPKAPAVDLDTLLTRIANELTFDPYRGIVKQFVEFHAARIVTEVQQKMYMERIEQEAIDFRRFCLSFRYGRKWRETCRRLRLARQGKERRQRARRRLRESGIHDGSDAGSVSDISFATDQSSIRNHVRSRQQPTSQQATVDALFQSTNGGSKYSEERLGQKRPAGAILQSEQDGLKDSRHKRAKSDERTAAADRRSTISAIDDPRAELKRKSAFLGFVLPHDAPDKGTTTQTTYFKLKAMGIDPNDDYGLPARGSKRTRAESVNSQSSVPANQLRLPPAPTPPRYLERDRTPSEARQMLPPPPKAVRVSHDADEALFARLRAAREGLKDDTVLMRSTTSQAPELEQNVSVRSSGPSPSMALARAEARLRASRGFAPYGSPPSEGKDRNVPAYRLRESRFVPREQYSRAIERANEIRSNRSRESSRPGSRTGYSFSGSPVLAPPLGSTGVQDEMIDDSQPISLSEKADSARVNGETVFAHTDGQVEAPTYDFEIVQSNATITNAQGAIPDPFAIPDSHHQPSVKAHQDTQESLSQLDPGISLSAFNTPNPLMWSFSTTEPATTREASPLYHQDTSPEVMQGMPEPDIVQVLDFATDGIPHFEPPAPLVTSTALDRAPVDSTDHTIHVEDIPDVLSASFGPGKVIQDDLEAAASVAEPIVIDSQLEADTHVEFVPQASQGLPPNLYLNGDNVHDDDTLLTHPASPSLESRKWLGSGTHALGEIDQTEVMQYQSVELQGQGGANQRTSVGEDESQFPVHEARTPQDRSSGDEDEDGALYEDEVEEEIDCGDRSDAGDDESSEVEEGSHHQPIAAQHRSLSQLEDISDYDSEEEHTSAEDEPSDHVKSSAGLSGRQGVNEPAEISEEAESDAEGEEFDDEEDVDNFRQTSQLPSYQEDIEEDYSGEGSYDADEEDREQDLQRQDGGDEGDEDDEDEEDYSEEEEEDEIDPRRALLQYHQNRPKAYAPPPPAPNPALQVVGGTQDEAIELSD
jgi:hypothetical protein